METIDTNIDWTENDWLSFSSRLNFLLKQGKVKVTFTKKDGTNRVMNCSLNTELLPKLEITESVKSLRKQSTTSMAVYDLDINSWRSFIVKSITNITVGE